MFPFVGSKQPSSTLNNDGRIFRLPDEDIESDDRRTSYPQFFHNDFNDDDSDGDIRTVKTNTSLTLHSMEDNAGNGNVATAVFPLPSTSPSTTENTAAIFPNSPFNVTTTTTTAPHIICDNDDDDCVADDEREPTNRGSSEERAYHNRSVRPKKESHKIVSTGFPTISDWNHSMTTDIRPKVVTPSIAATSTPTVSTSSHSTPDRSNVYHYLIDERIAMATNSGTIRTIVPAKPNGNNIESPYSDRIKEDNSSLYSSSSSPSPNGKGYVDMSPMDDSIVEPMLLNMSGRDDDDDDDEEDDYYSSSHNNGSPFVDESSYSFSLGGGNLSIESPPRDVLENAVFPVPAVPQNIDHTGVDMDSNWIKTSWSYLQMMAKTASSSLKVGANDTTTIVDLDDTVVSSQPSMTNNTYNNNNDILSLNGNDDQLTYDSTLFQKKNEHGGRVLTANNYCVKDETSTLASTGSTYEYCMNNIAPLEQQKNQSIQNLSEPVKLIHEGTQSTFIVAYGSSEDDSTKDAVSRKSVKDVEKLEIIDVAQDYGDDGASTSGQGSKRLNTAQHRRRRCMWKLGALLVLLMLAFTVSEVVCIFFSCRHLGLFSKPKAQSSDESKSIDNLPTSEEVAPATSPMASLDSSSVVPTSAPSLRAATSTTEPTMLPTAQDTMVVDPLTLIPTVTPTFDANIILKFNTTDELYNAVDLYLMAYVNASIPSNLPPIERWDVSQLYNLSKVFSASRNPLARYFDADLSLWNTSNVGYMGSIFQQAENFNGDITTWDVSRVIDMQEAFASAYKFNRDISLWNVAKVQQMSQMFLNCAHFNQNIGLWNTSSAISMQGMFKNAPSFNQDLFWDTGRVYDMSQMFEDADAFDGDVSTFNLSAAVNVQMMFRNAISFTGKPDLSLWQFSNVEDAREMFYGAISFQGIGIPMWTIVSLLNPNLMFAGAKAFSQNLCSNWHTALLLLDGTKNMFAGTSCPHEEIADPIYPERSNLYCFSCSSTIPPTISTTAPPSIASFTRKAFTTNVELRIAVDEYLLDDSPASYVAFQYGYPIGAWDVSMLTDFSHIFDSYRNSNLLRFNADLSGWNVSNAVSMYAMFQQTASFTDATNGLASWDVAKVTDMSGMFSLSAFSGNISAWQVGRVTDFSFFADFASSFTSDLSTWNVSSAQDMSWMFRASKSFNSDISSWDISSVTDFSSMFSGASSFNQNLCTWGSLIQAAYSNVTTIPTIESRNMFAATSCPYLLEPNATNGPWCTSCVL